MTWDTATIDENNTGVTGFNFNHTVGAGINRWGRIIIWGGGSNLTISGTPTFGGVAMTPVTNANPHNNDPVFANLYLFDIVAPATGVNAVVGNFTGSVMATIIAISRDEVNQVIPCGDIDVDTPFESNNTPSADTTSEVGDEVVSIIATGGTDTPSAGNTITVTGSGQTLLAASGNTGENHVTGVSYSPGAATVTQSWDLSPVGGDISGYHIQFNINTDGAAPPPPVGWNLRNRVMNGRPRPFAPGRIR